MRNTGGRTSHATVVAYLALFVALSGTAIAASGKIGSSQIKKGGVKSKNLAKEAVKKNKIDKGAVQTDRIKKQAVTQGKLAPESVGNAKLQTNSVTQKNLQNGSVGTAQLLSESVGDGKLKASSVIRSKIAGAAVDASKVEDGSLGWSKVAQLVSDVSLTTGEVVANACADTEINVPGVGSLAGLLVIPRISGWDTDFILDAFAPRGNDDVTVRVCNLTGSNATPDPLPIRVLGFS